MAKLDFEILQQQECSSTREQVAGHVRHGSARPFGQIARGESAERLCAEDHRAERRCARQVVFDAMARRRRASRRPLLVGIDDEGIGAFLGRRQVELCSEQPLIEEPDATGIGAGRCRPDDRLDRSGAGGLERAISGREDRALHISERSSDALRESPGERAGVYRYSIRPVGKACAAGRLPRAYAAPGLSAEMRRSGRHTQQASPAPGAIDPEKP